MWFIIFPFVSSLCVRSLTKEKNPERFRKSEILLLREPADCPDVGQKSRQLVEGIRRKCESLIQVPETRFKFSSECTTKRPPSPRAKAILSVTPLAAMPRIALGRAGEILDCLLRLRTGFAGESISQM
jgi:hypothetical protein